MQAGRAGAIDAVVAAMRAHVDDAIVSQQACGALQNICCTGWLIAIGFVVVVVVVYCEYERSIDAP